MIVLAIVIFFHERGAQHMKALIAFLLGMTAGVGVMRLIDGMRASQARLLAFFLIGVLVGIIASAMCIGGWRGE